MKNENHVFHLAIPCRDLEEARRFYVDKLGCRLARLYSDRITLDFYGDQVVCHLSPDKTDSNPEIYPRHFGITFRFKRDFDAMLERVRESGIGFYKDVFVRFPGKREEHWTFFISDPSNNLIEFKWYLDEEMIY
ncbi:MAG: VOC family protein [Candidatus Dadabacteria bacterium]|nr:VOC family protein [Candidatus Dadabacteria bacterium]